MKKARNNMDFDPFLALMVSTSCDVIMVYVMLLHSWWQNFVFSRSYVLQLGDLTIGKFERSQSQVGESSDFCDTLDCESQLPYHLQLNGDKILDFWPECKVIAAYITGYVEIIVQQGGVSSIIFIGPQSRIGMVSPIMYINNNKYISY